MKNNRIVIVDTMLRSTEQCSGASINPREKIGGRHGVDVIEVRLPFTSA